MSMAALRWARSIRHISGTQKLVLWALADMANDYGEAWPTAIAVAEDCCLSERAVREAMDTLESRGLMTGTRALGRAARWVLHLDRQAELPTGSTPAGGSGGPERGAATPERGAGVSAMPITMEPNAGSPERGSGVAGADPGTSCRGTPERGSDPPRNVVPGTPERGSDITLKNPHRTPSEPSHCEQPPAVRVTGFEDWWQAYPRKVGKDAARTAYAAAVKRGAAEIELADALQRQRWPAEVRFIPHARTWLTQGRWQDEPGDVAPPAAQPKTATSEWADLLGYGEPRFDIDGTAEETSH